MRIKNSFKMALANSHAIYKLLIYRILVYIVVGLLGVLLIGTHFKSIIDESGVERLIQEGVNVIKNLFNPSQLKGDFTAELTSFKNYFSTNMDKVTWFIVAVIGLYFLNAFLINISDYALGVVISEHMSSLANRGFVISLTKNLGKAVLYSLIALVYKLVIYTVGGLFAFGVFTLLSKVIGVLALTFAILFFIIIWAFGNVFILFLLASLISDGLTFKQAMKKSFSVPKNEIWLLFTNLFTIFILVVYFNVSVAIFTFFTGLALSIPLSSLFFVSFLFVNYSTMNKRKFYITSKEIVTFDEEEEESILKEIL